MPGELMVSILYETFPGTEINEETGIIVENA